MLSSDITQDFTDLETAVYRAIEFELRKTRGVEGYYYSLYRLYVGWDNPARFEKIFPYIAYSINHFDWEICCFIKELYDGEVKKAYVKVWDLIQKQLKIEKEKRIHNKKIDEIVIPKFKFQSETKTEKGSIFKRFR